MNHPILPFRYTEKDQYSPWVISYYHVVFTGDFGRWNKGDECFCLDIEDKSIKELGVPNHRTGKAPVLKVYNL